MNTSTMTTNDALLNHMIQQDMKLKNVSHYSISDNMVEAPETIEVKNNEAVYVHLIHQFSGSSFTISLVSPTSAVRLTKDNTESGKSNLISKHFGNIDLSLTSNNNFFVHYVRVKY